MSVDRRHYKHLLARGFKLAFNHRNRRLVSCAAIAVAFAGTASRAVRAGDDSNAGREQYWVGTWGASPQLTTGAPSFNNQTIRQIVRISVGGVRFRVRLTNEYGTQAVQIGATHVAISAGAAAIEAGTDRVVTFSGNPSIAIPPQAAVLSDPVDLRAPNLASLAISIYIPQSTGPGTWHVDGRQTAYIVLGDATGAANIGSSATTTTSRFFLSGVEAARFAPKSAVVTLGDSITDGHNSTVDADHRWPDFLAVRLAASRDDDIGVVDEGISGNRILHDVVGPNALARFDRDVLATPGVRFVTVLLGINDIGLGARFPTQAVTVDEIIAGYRQFIARSHSRGIRIYGATLTPFNGAAYYSAAGDVKRREVNRWIRTAGEFDAVIDFDAVVRDPGDPSRILPVYDSGDHLHPSDAGYQAMANAIDLRLFRVSGGDHADQN
jgi:lysophospholipase L1-like esterase